MIFRTFDIETTSLNAYDPDSEIFAYCIGDTDGKVEVTRPCDKKKLQAFFDDTSIAKIAHNFMFELAYLKQKGIIVPPDTIWHDTMIMSQMLRNLAPSHALAQLCEELAGYCITTPMGTFTSMEIDAKVKAQADARGKRYDRVNKLLMHWYQIADGQRPMLLFQTFWPEFEKDPRLLERYNIEIEFVKSCERMQKTGIKVDNEGCHILQDDLHTRQNRILDDMQYRFGEYINLNSNPKVANMLHVKLGLPILSYTTEGRIATDKEVLFKYLEAYPKYTDEINMILKQRSFSGGISNIDGYLSLQGSDGIIHPNINSNLAKTGRPSCSKPNLLNVAKEDARRNPFPIPARKCFKHHDECVLYFGDYAGLQMRLIADACGETEMLEIIKNGGDVHEPATELLYSGVEDPIVKKDLLSAKDWKSYRGAAKNAHFGMPFGGGEGAIIESLKLPWEIGMIGIDAYRGRFPRITNYASSQIDQVKRFGYVITPGGRRLHVLRDKPYIGANYYIQGTEAEIMKEALVKVDKYFRDNWDDRIRLILDIYDETIISCPIKLAEQFEYEVLTEVSKLMTDISNIDVRLDMEWKKSYTTWYAAKKLILRKKLKLKKKVKLFN